MGWSPQAQRCCLGTLALTQPTPAACVVTSARSYDTMRTMEESILTVPWHVSWSFCVRACMQLLSTRASKHLGWSQAVVLADVRCLHGPAPARIRCAAFAALCSIHFSIHLPACRRPSSLMRRTSSRTTKRRWVGSQNECQMRAQWLTRVRPVWGH